MASELKKLTANSPTSLIQSYYSCVLAPWPAFYAAVGLGSASMGVYVPLAFAIYMLLSVQLLNHFNKAGIPAKAKKVSGISYNLFINIIYQLNGFCTLKCLPVHDGR